MMIQQITYSADYNYWLKRMNTKLNKLTNQNLIKVPKVVRHKNKTLF